ncbi:GNAT family N-acetyltransferase [Streptomyces sp. SID14478]|uniref:GNAT family N-acetyltransferase n=1 Tax=Streptomyces sp. SID14478 TaxID=2706073 RepID=UPI0013DC8136|nr:GNAT family N-acetyltransferase [Streptomyces sp. SID14478]NEB79036.1 GNAT family N-acetyltransferase [Streptomyces sp. SID14478]
MTLVDVHLRPARPDDAETVARLHADSWRRHYRGAYADAFLDGDVVADRRDVWTGRLGSVPAHGVTILAEAGGESGALVGFVHVVLDDDARWGSLVDNLHVTHELRGRGLGRILLTSAAAAAAERASGAGLYLWVQEQNTAAQGFYRAMGGRDVEAAPIAPPAGEPRWLNGAPRKLRIVWEDAKEVGA